MAVVERTAVSIEISKIRNPFVPVTSGNCLKIAAATDWATLSGAFLWTSRWSCFFKANVLSTPNNAARVICNDSEEIIMTVNGLKVQQGGANVTSANILIYNQWHDYGIVYDGSYCHFHRDGARISSKALTTNPSTNNWTHTLFSNPAHNRNCDMSVAYLQFYTKAFTPEEVVEHYFGKSKDTTSLRLQLRLNEGTGTTATDSSTSGLNATINNCTWSKFNQPQSTFSYGESSVV